MEPNKIIMNPMYNNTWAKLFDGIESKVNPWNVRKMLLRLLVNPSKELRKAFINERKKIIRLPHTIGLQLRIGGELADSPEEYTGVPISRLDEVLDQIRAIIRKRKWEGKVQIYISSDSSKVIRMIQNKTQNEFPVVESTLFKHGHTNLNRDEYLDVTSKVLSDFYYMTTCDRVVITWPSSLGRLMYFMMDENKCDAVLNWWSPSKKIPFPTKK